MKNVDDRNIKDRKVVTFEQTGLGTIQDDVDRTGLSPGDKFLIQRIRHRNSAKYGRYVVMDGIDENDTEVHKYTTSQVIIEQADALMKAFEPDADGYLTTLVWTNVEERKSVSGRKYLTLA